jgi:hypothetical protein
MPFDTSPEAEAIQLEVFRRMTPAQRIEMALEMSESIRNVSLSGLRQRHPELNEQELRRELLRLMYGFSPEP